MNSKISKVLRDISFYLEMQDDTSASFKARAYRRASEIIANYSDNIKDVYAKKGVEGLMEIPSVGPAIASKIEEYLTKGRIDYLEGLKIKTPVKIDEFYGLDGVGPKTLRILYERLQITGIDDLERAAAQGKLKGIQGFTEKKIKSITQNIKFLHSGRGRRLLGEVYPLIKQIEEKLAGVTGVKIAMAAGSVRRMTETIGDIDYLVVSSNAEKVIDFFVSMPEVEEVISKGPSKVFVKLNNGIDSDLLVVPEGNFGSALVYFTGSKEHGVQLRKLAQSKGLRLNEWGVFKDNEQIAGLSEEDVYSTLGLDYIVPEMRENNGEIELAKSGKLPDLIDYGDLKGDLQVHSNSTDGVMTIEEMAIAARDKFGLNYIAITDHTISLRLARGLDEKQLMDQAERIYEINDRLSSSTAPDFRVFASAEVNIMKDGSLDISNNVLDRLDIVGAAIHSNFNLPIEDQTMRLTRAAENPSVDIIFHPTGRLLNKREGYPVDIDRLIDVAKNTGTVLEIDAYYDRLDLRDSHIRKAVESGIKLSIDTDAHHPIHFAFSMFGVAQARRGWAEKNDIINTMHPDQLLRNLK